MDSTFDEKQWKRSKIFGILPFDYAATPIIYRYFRDLRKAGTLKYRFSDVEHPGLDTVREVISRMHQHMYLVMSRITNKPLGEFTLEGFTGRSAQAHFSTHPDADTNTRIDIGRYALSHTLTRRNKETKEFYLDSLYGLTPLKNRAACIYALKIGYKKQGILPSGMMYEGKPEDCQISVASRETLR